VAVTAPDVLPPASRPPGFASDARAGVLTAVGVVLLGAPLGLLWAAVAPRVEVVVAAGGATRLAEPASDGFIAVDGAFLALVLVAGVLSGVVAWWLGRRHGPGVVVGLVVGGLLAAEVASRTGALVDAGEARAALEAGREGVVALSVRLRSEPARLGWPVAALAAHMVLTLFDARRTA
jgi:hypothetical protein